MIAGVPWWVIGVIILIFFSGYMAYRTSVAERKLIDHYIEQEGQVYMERIEKERKKREARKQERALTQQRND